MNGSYSIVIDGERFEIQVEDLGGSSGERRFQVRIGEREHSVSVVQEAQSPKVSERPDLSSVPRPKTRSIEPSQVSQGDNGQKKAVEGTAVGAPMTGKIVSINVSDGQEVKEGDLLMVLEAMKMENSILATEGGVVSKIAISVGDNVRKGDQLCLLSQAG